MHGESKNVVSNLVLGLLTASQRNAYSHFKLELLRLLKEIVHDKLAHKVRVQSVLNRFCPSKLSPHQHSNMTKHFKMKTKTVGHDGISNEHIMSW